jgi:formate hydrogenlyase subunit 6/NADH:ubiquinone oxidoreductase subunit I
VTLTVSVASGGCGMFLVTSPERALRPARRRPSLVATRCTGCLACVEVCPVGAISPTKACRR